jgi:serine O-acetyltransferase
MKHSREEITAKKLAESYKRDRLPFLTDLGLKFPERKGCFGEVMILRELLFPNYWNSGHLTDPENVNALEAKVRALGTLLAKGIRPCVSSESDAHAAAGEVLSRLPEIREALKKDVEAAYSGDPAARGFAEIIRAYPGFMAVMVQRVAHVLHELKVPSYPRELTEHANSLTGIDIHPGAKIGEYFFIDHGSGVVIGETAEIGDWVRLYQGVTLGVLHFEHEGEVLKKGYKRHPTIGSHVVIGAGAKILGPVVIGDRVNIGANSWIQEDIPSGTTVYVSEHPKLARRVRSEPRK